MPSTSHMKMVDKFVRKRYASDCRVQLFLMRVQEPKLRTFWSTWLRIVLLRKLACTHKSPISTRAI